MLSKKVKVQIAAYVSSISHVLYGRMGLDSEEVDPFANEYDYEQVINGNVPESDVLLCAIWHCCQHNYTEQQFVAHCKTVPTLREAFDFDK